MKNGFLKTEESNRFFLLELQRFQYKNNRNKRAHTISPCVVLGERKIKRGGLGLRENKIQEQKGDYMEGVKQNLLGTVATWMHNANIID